MTDREGQSDEPNADSTRKPIRGPLPLRMTDQVLLAAGLAAALVCLTLYWVRTAWPHPYPVELEPAPGTPALYQIDINEATWIEWTQLPGIGPTLARRIVEERERNGPYSGVEDLGRVPGLGSLRIQSLRPYVKVPEAPEAPATEAPLEPPANRANGA